MMKKLILLMMLFCNINIANAQSNDTVLYVENIETFGGSIYLCKNHHSRAIVYPQPTCEGFHWEGTPFGWSDANPLVLDSDVATHFSVTYIGCNFLNDFGVTFGESNVPGPTLKTLWKHEGYPTTLEAVGADSLNMYSFHWNTNENTGIIDVTAPGTYTCVISDYCAFTIRTFIVKDNVELYRASVDLETKLNKVTWQVTPEQAEYIGEVKVERDGMVVGTAPYEQGYFMDNIGSENAARNYRLTGITTDGIDCPIPSYQKGTLHVDYSPNASNPNKLNMAWTPPFIEEGAFIAVSYFQICKYDPNTGEVTVVDQIGANNTIGSYDVDLFDEGYAVVAAMFNEGKDYEDLAFSNLTEFLVGIEENEGPSTPSTGSGTSGTLTVYPNPAKDCVTIEGSGTLTITNTLGQTILTKEIDGKTTIELPQGMYFVKLGGITRKIVVE